MCVGDAFVLKTYTPTTGDENILMKVVKINNSKETNRVYVINSKTTFYEVDTIFTSTYHFWIYLVVT